LVGSTLSLFREEAAANRISLEATTAPEIGVVSADERKVRQVLVNLVANALKFTPDGGRVSVAATRSNGAIDIAVTDTGPGIVPAEQERIFEEFAQASDNGRSPGTGLGLALARRFAELHGGTLTVRSTPGQGATFTLRLPARRPAPEPVA
ncbi:MAG: histidine kinase, partial [Mycobacterium sp.]|nr:histidine kinase [Mycobacterium sp.]